MATVKRNDPGSRLAFAARSDTGRKRGQNEDRVATDPPRGLAVLADGMGGHKGGEIASQLAVETIVGEFAQSLGDLDGKATESEAHALQSVLGREIVAHANTLIRNTARSQPQYEGMGTTLVTALFYDDRVSLFHVGDSRAYRLRGAQLEQLTRDHSLVQELVDRGFYTLEEARASLNRNVVTRALGIEDDVVADVFEEIVLPGDVYLLCSDGLTDLIEDQSILLTLMEFGDNLEGAADRLIEQANEQGGHDNISVVLVRVLKAFSTSRGWFKRFVDWF